MAVKRDILELLWATSFGVCAYPGCNQDLACIMTQDIIGHICHIVAQKPNGPRGDVDYPCEKIDEFDNLILLCPTHHTIVDKDVNAYTVDDLKDMKALHYQSMKQRLQSGQAWSVNFSQIYYLNIPRLASLPYENSSLVDFSWLKPNQRLHDFGLELNSVMLTFKDVLHKLDIGATSLSSPWSNYRPGQIITFDEKFRTKNVPELDVFKNFGYTLRGDLKFDPYLYAKRDDVKFILAIDPRWMATTTSFVNFRMGWVDVAGLAIVKSVDPKKILATPYVIGTPRNELTELLYGNRL